MRHPGHNRALYMPMTNNNKLLWTPEGMDWLVSTVVKLTPENENTALRLADCLQLVRKLDDDIKPLAVDALETMRNQIDAEKHPSISGRINSFLA